MKPVPRWYEWAIRALLRLYPQRFRAQFGDALLDAWRDQYRFGRRAPADRLRQLADHGRDLALSVVEQHQRDPQAAGHARLPLLIAMFLALLALIGQRALVPAVVDGIERSEHAWWTYASARYSPVITAYYGTIADDLTGAGDARRHAAGALLIRALEVPAPDAAAIARQQRRRAALESAQDEAPDDPVVLFAVAGSCELTELTQGDISHCPSPERRSAALARLLERDADNGATWMLAADAAAARHDRAGVSAALARVAAASRYDNHYRDFNGRIVAAALARPPHTDAWDRWVVGLVPDATWVWSPGSQWTLEGERACPMWHRPALDPAACLGARERVRSSSDSFRARVVAANYLVKHRGSVADRRAADALRTIAFRLEQRLHAVGPADLAEPARRLDREGDAPLLEWVADGR
jgi:hypothetical protein